MNDYEARRQANIKRNHALVQELGLDLPTTTTTPPSSRRNTAKRRKLAAPAAAPLPPTRSSARLAARPTAANPPPAQSTTTAPRGRRGHHSSSTAPTTTTPLPPPEITAIIAGWTSWTPAAPPPTRDALGTYHFPSHPSFTPNKSPADILREGAFGGSYFRPFFSRTLGVLVRDDWRELPASWTEGLDPARYLASEEYDASVNKFGVACGQSLEAWEAAGWMRVEWDVRGWFQWYCRFWQGRRGADDERQVGRWERCVGERGRWRRALLKRYGEKGVRDVADEGGEEAEVSPVVHQTCHQWGWEVRQEELDRFWEGGR